MTYRHTYSLGAAAASAGPAFPSKIGKIVWPGGSYQMTPDDILWLARSTQYEGGTAPASTIWTYAQRYVLFRSRFPTLMALVRAHSQPINPAWDQASDPLCVANPERCTPAQLDRRAQAATKPWNELNPAIRALVVRFAAGELPNPVPRATDFADETVTRSFIARNPGTRIIQQAGNWYVAEPAALRWPDGYVRITGGSNIGLVLGLAIAGVAVASAGYVAYKRLG